MANGIIFPTHVYGQLSDKYGLNITAYNTSPNTSGFPAGSGLQLGQFGELFDGTVVRMVKATNSIAQNDAVTLSPGNGNNYTVKDLPGVVNTGFITGVNDRVGGALIANDFAWMTVYGNGTGNVAGSTAAGSSLTSSATAGQMQAATIGTSANTNVFLPNASTTAGAYAICIF